jgi:hypothetical protein
VWINTHIVWNIICVSKSNNFLLNVVVTLYFIQIIIVYLTPSKITCLAAQVKTTAPDKFRVRPSSGTISSLQTASISVIVQKGQMLQPMNKDKFLVMCMPLPEDNPLTTDEISNLWKGVNAGSPEVEQHRLKCTVPTSVAASLITGSDLPTRKIIAEHTKVTDSQPFSPLFQ